jgi:hypothetical protein
MASRREATGSGRESAEHWPHLFDQALALPAGVEHRSWWTRPGLSSRGERLLNVVGTVVLLALTAGWGWTLATGHSPLVDRETSSPTQSLASTITTALTNRDAPTTAYLTDAALVAIVNRALAPDRGASGKLKVNFQPTPHAITTDSLPPGAAVEYTQGSDVVTAPKGSGIWNVVLKIGNAIRPIADFSVITMLPFNAKQNGHIGAYFIGSWPSEAGVKGPAKAPSSAYANPAGFIEVTQANRNTPVSEHFKLGDFVTHDQANVWPKYIVLQQKLIDKLELVLSDLAAHGYDVHGVRVMSGFRTPQYNAAGGNPAGRANLSRHMYGDASDIYIDSNGDGQMDDLNHDGKVTIDDSRVISAAVDRVEAAHPELVGGAGVYTAAPGHGPFIHIDTRGYRARWTGTSGG